MSRYCNLLLAVRAAKAAKGWSPSLGPAAGHSGWPACHLPAAGVSAAACAAAQTGAVPACHLPAAGVSAAACAGSSDRSCAAPVAQLPSRMILWSGPPGICVNSNCKCCSRVLPATAPGSTEQDSTRRVRRLSPDTLLAVMVQSPVGSSCKSTSRLRACR